MCSCVWREWIHLQKYMLRGGDLGTRNEEPSESQFLTQWDKLLGPLPWTAPSLLNISVIALAECKHECCCPFLECCCPLLFFFFFYSHACSSWTRVKSKLQLLAYSTATATLDSNHHFDICGSLRPCRILNPLSGALNQTCILMATSWVLDPLSHNRNSPHC